MASRIRQEDTKQPEETNGVKKPDKKTLNSKKKPMASGIRWEDTYQQEEINGVKYLPRRHPAQEENQGFKTPAKKNMQQEIQEETYSKKQIQPRLVNWGNNVRNLS